jgi:hypothetical protein
VARGGGDRGHAVARQQAVQAGANGAIFTLAAGKPLALAAALRYQGALHHVAVISGETVVKAAGRKIYEVKIAQNSETTAMRVFLKHNGIAA